MPSGARSRAPGAGASSTCSGTDRARPATWPSACRRCRDANLLIHLARDRAEGASAASGGHDAYFVDPPPAPRYAFLGGFGATLHVEAFTEAVSFNAGVLGPPSYVERDDTRGWPIGAGWLTLLRGPDGNPRNVELTFEVATVEEAERLHAACVAAGGRGSAPSDQLMYRPVRACPVVNPFGTELMIVAGLPTASEGGSVR